LRHAGPARQRLRPRPGKICRQRPPFAWPKSVAAARPSNNSLTNITNIFGTGLAMVLAMVRPQGLPANPVGDQVMGIFGALTAAVTGLRAQSYALENVAGNIANSQTTAFKRVDTSFEDLIGDASPSKQVAGSVVAS